MRHLPQLGTGYSACIATPFAIVGVRTSYERLVSLEYLPQGAATLAPTDALSREVERQIDAYVRNARFRWDLPYDLEGTTFQCRVWTQIQDIPCGQVRRYGEIAKSIQTSARAVGTCCGANRLPLIVPCHRVVAASGIGGFMHTWQEGAALRVKRWLLQHEGVTL